MSTNFFDFQASLRRPRPGTPPAPGAAADGQALSVSQVTSRITKVLGAGMPASLLVRGEVSNLSRNKSSGHLYFTLKDPEACLDCVMFRGEAARLKFEPADGMEMLASGRIGVYPQRGRYQLYVSTLRPLGQGALELAFQQTRAKLEAEGLFAAAGKKPLPAYPRRIVLVTSREAAALQDVLKVLGRFPWLRLMIYPVPVQGDGAAQKIAEALAHLNATTQSHQAELILLVRGGGSLEDLWAFNEEAVARAVAGSRVPVVTGIGHEVDVSIADLVADHHAHTPTEAAQVATAGWRGAKDQLDSCSARMSRAVRSVLSDAAQRLRAIERHETFRRPADRVCNLRQLLDDRQRSMILALERLLHDRADRLRVAEGRVERFLPALLFRFRDLLTRRRQQLDARLVSRLRVAQERISRAGSALLEHHPKLRVKLAAQRVAAVENRLLRAMAQSVSVRRQRLEAVGRQLEAVSPQSVLRRGYTITTRKKDGLPLRSAENVRPGDKLVTRFADGEVESVAGDSKQLSLFD